MICRPDRSLPECLSGAAQHRFDNGAFEIFEYDPFGKIDLRTESLSLGRSLFSTSGIES